MIKKIVDQKNIIMQQCLSQYDEFETVVSFIKDKAMELLSLMDVSEWEVSKLNTSMKQFQKIAPLL